MVGRPPSISYWGGGRDAPVPSGVGAHVRSASKNICDCAVTTVLRDQHETFGG